MHLARLGLQIAVQEFVKAIPEFRKDGFRVPYYVGNILHVPDFHLQWAEQDRRLNCRSIGSDCPKRESGVGV
jgi:hypothetical protein